MLMAIHVIGQVTSELTKMFHLGPKLHLHLSIKQKQPFMELKNYVRFRCRMFIVIYKRWPRQQI